MVIGSGTFATVTRDAKLVQDFRHYLLERIGSDPLYPWYGSRLEDASMIGTADFAFARTSIEAEVRRVAASYQNMQLERAKSERSRYKKSTLTAGEILAAVSQVECRQEADTLRVIIHITTGTDEQLLVEADLPPVYSR